MQDEERRIASLMAKKDEDKKRETDKLAKMKVGISNLCKWYMMYYLMALLPQGIIEVPELFSFMYKTAWFTAVWSWCSENS